MLNELCILPRCQVLDRTPVNQVAYLRRFGEKTVIRDYAYRVSSSSSFPFAFADEVVTWVRGEKWVPWRYS